MQRIFLTLAVLDALALLAAFAVGTVSKVRGGLLNLSDPTYLIHYHLGLFAVLGTLLVHCLVMVYFLGTGRLIKETCLAYDLPDSQWPRLTRDLKRDTTPKAILAMLLTIAVAAAGEGDQHRVWPWWIHLTLAPIVLAVNPWVFRVQYRNIGINAKVLDEVFREVDRVREERGLPSNAEALRQDDGWR